MQMFLMSYLKPMGVPEMTLLEQQVVRSAAFVGTFATLLERMLFAEVKAEKCPPANLPNDCPNLKG